MINLKSSFNPIKKQYKANKRFRYFVLLLFYLFVFLCLVFVWEVYIPKSRSSSEMVTYTAKKGHGYEDIAKDLQGLGLIKSGYFFKIYVIATLQHSKLQAGKYLISPGMSVYQIARKMSSGDVLRHKITILEGWELSDIKKYFEENNILSGEDFDKFSNTDFSSKFDFLSDKPKDVSLEGYLFPDTYEICDGQGGEEIFKTILSNFNKKLTQDVKDKIASQNKSVFEIITVASLLEKEVRSVEDKKIVAGIIYKRLDLGMPLQMDATINYITGKNDPGAALKDLKIDSPYNTYKYTGLPKGPISNPGIESILAAISPKETQYLYYLNTKGGQIVFSKTMAQHSAAIAKYLR